MDRKVRGLTMGELLIVIVIISVLAYIGYQEIEKAVANQRLKNSTQTLVTNLERIKRNSITGRALWGASIQNDNSYILFEDTNGNCRLDQNDNNTRRTIVNLDPGIRFHNTPSRTIVFDRKGVALESSSNEECRPAALPIQLRNTYNKTATITIGTYGEIRYAY